MVVWGQRRKCSVNHCHLMKKHSNLQHNITLKCIYANVFLPGLVEAWTRPQVEFGLRPAIMSLWWGFKPSVSRLCRAGHRQCSTRRPRDGFIVLSPDKAWEETRQEKQNRGRCDEIRRDKGKDEKKKDSTGKERRKQNT